METPHTPQGGGNFRFVFSKLNSYYILLNLGSSIVRAFSGATAFMDQRFPLPPETAVIYYELYHEKEIGMIFRQNKNQHVCGSIILGKLIPSKIKKYINLRDSSRMLMSINNSKS